jgi:hypothetical protein
MLQRIDTFSRSVPALRTTGAGSERHRVSLEWLICGDLTGLLQTVGDRPAGDCRATETDRAAAKSGTPKTGNSGDSELVAGLHRIMGE